MTLPVQEEEGQRGAFFIKRGSARVAELTYGRESPTLVIIDHVEVQEDLAGQGIGHQLLTHAVEWARATNTKLLSTCPFVSRQFSKEPERYADVLG